jgi:hypothetical protein
MIVRTPSARPSRSCLLKSCPGEFGDRLASTKVKAETAILDGLASFMDYSIFCIDPPWPSGRIVRARLARSNRKISAQRFRARKALENRQNTPRRNTAGSPFIDRRLPTTRLMGGFTRLLASARLPFSSRKPTELGASVKNQHRPRVSNPPTFRRLFRHGTLLPRIARPSSCIRPRPVAMSGRVVEASFSQARSYSRKQNTGREPDIPAIWPVRVPLVVTIALYFSRQN